MRRNNSLIGRAAVVLGLLFALFGTSQTAYAATTFDVTLPDLVATQGASFSIPVTINTTGGNVASVDIGIAYDPNVIRITAYNGIGGWFASGNFAGSAAGNITFGGINASGQVFSNASFGTLDANVVGNPGESSVMTISVNPANNTDSTFTAVTVGTLTNGSVSIASPPSVSLPGDDDVRS